MTAKAVAKPRRSISQAKKKHAAHVRAQAKRASSRAKAKRSAPVRRRATVSRHRPWTLEHFLEWSKDLICDNGNLFAPEPFQIEFLRDLFVGRLENWLILPEGNGKSTLVAVVILYHCDVILGAFVPVAASSRDQAEILYRQAEGFVLRTKRLERVFKCLEGYRRIRHKKNRSRIQIMAADANTGDGVIPTLAIVEELHRHKDLKLYRTWRGKIRKRPGAQIVTISTAGEPYSEFEDTREKIRELPGAEHGEAFIRAASDQIVIHDWAVPPKGDVRDMALVKKANPFSAITVETLEADFDSPTMTLAHWSRFKCDIPTRAVRSAVSSEEWARAESKKGIPVGEPIDVGLDVAWKWDTTAIVPLWTPSSERRLFGPATILEPPRDGTSLHPDEIKKALIAVHERNKIGTIVMDVTRAEDLTAWIRDELGVENIVEWPQTNDNEVLQYEKFMAALRTAHLKHSGDRGLTRHVLNAIARMLPSGKSRFDRTTQTREVKQQGLQDRRVIDALTAASMVHAYYAQQLGENTEPLVAWG